MTSPLALHIEGIGAWAHGAVDWNELRGVLRGEQTFREDAVARPAASALPAAERRRAPDSVLLAAEVARQACAMAARNPAELPCVFACTQGELAITDYLCETLARAPHDLSPTKFHNSVHNAPAGYWTIATHCTAGSSAVSAHRVSFGAGLLEAATLALADNTPVLFAAYDVAAAGPLIEMARTACAFGAALLLAPSRDAHANPCLMLQLRGGAAVDIEAPPGLETLSADNPLTAHALALLAALAGDVNSRLTLPAASGLLLDMEIVP